MSTQTICPSCMGLNRVPLEGPKGKAPICGRCQTPLPFHDGVTEVTDITLPALIAKSSLPVVVDFWAPWCAPCKAFAPTFAASARELSGQFLFAKLNTETQRHSGQSFQIRSIPTLIKFQGGKEIKRISGALPMSDFMRWTKE